MKVLKAGQNSPVIAQTDAVAQDRELNFEITG
jgi:hypothetical protein